MKQYKTPALNQYIVGGHGANNVTALQAGIYAYTIRSTGNVNTIYIYSTLQSSDVICTMTAYNILRQRQCLILLHIYKQLKTLTVDFLSRDFKTLLFNYFLKK
jgi:hypothetical protein